VCHLPFFLPLGDVALQIAQHLPCAAKRASHCALVKLYVFMPKFLAFPRALPGKLGGRVGIHASPGHDESGASDERRSRFWRDQEHPADGILSSNARMEIASMAQELRAGLDQLALTPKRTEPNHCEYLGNVDST
jgi:hypothetical protein